MPGYWINDLAIGQPVEKDQLIHSESVLVVGWLEFKAQMLYVVAGGSLKNLYMGVSNR